MWRMSDSNDTPMPQGSTQRWGKGDPIIWKKCIAASNNMVAYVHPARLKKQFCAFLSRTSLHLVCATEKNAADLGSQNAPVALGSTRWGLEEHLSSRASSQATRRLQTFIFQSGWKHFCAHLSVTITRFVFAWGWIKKKKNSKSAVDLDSHDAPVLAVRASARSADRLLVSRPAGLHAATPKKKIEDWQSCDWTSIWEKRKDGERGGGRGRQGFKKWHRGRRR